MTCESCRKNRAHADFPLVKLCGFCWAEAFKASGQKCPVTEAMQRLGMCD